MLLFASWKLKEAEKNADKLIINEKLSPSLREKGEVTVKEKDFLSYMAKSSFEFKKITEQKKFDKTPVPYYECVNRGKNGGGWTFRYTVPEEKFFGAYSHH